MSAPPVWTPPRPAISQNFGGLLDKLVKRHGLADLNAAGLQAFMDAPGDGVALVLDEPERVPESWDLAVIFPDLLNITDAKPRGAVLRPAAAKSIQAQFGIHRLPALLFLRDGGYVGVIQGLRDWNEYVVECRAMAQTPVSRPPSVGIAVMTDTSSSCH